MASEKKPSIYSDRGTIGSSDELDEYGVWVKTEPQDLSLASGPETQEKADFFAEASGLEISDDTPAADDLDLSIPDLEDLPDFDTLQEEASKNAFPDDDFSLPEDDSNSATELDLPDMVTFAESTGDSDDANDGFAEISMDDFIGTLDAEAGGKPVEEPIENIPEDLSTEFVSFDAEPVEEELAAEHSVIDTAVEQPEFVAEAPVAIESSAPAFSPETGPEKEPQASPDLSTQLLMRIAEELSSIRTELGSLKREFSELKTAAPPPAASESGFFNKEEDDEKIALTGDELNNILNTADFTEEAGSDATMELPGEAVVQEPEDSTADSADDISSGEELDLGLMDFDINLDDTDMPELEPEYSGAPKDAEAMPFFTVEDSEELKNIRENGVEPMAFAPAPEDENYLTEDPLAQEPIAQETLADEPLLAEEPLIEEPLAEEPLIEEPLIEEPIIEEPLIEEPLVEESLIEEPINEEPLIEEPLVEEETAGLDEISTELEIEPFTDISTETAAEDLPEPIAAPIDEHFPDESIDLSEAIIDEPDLSAGIQDNPLEEPSLDDISISLDLSELGSGEISLTGSEDDEVHTNLEETGLSAEPSGELSEEELELPLDISESELQSVEEAEDEAAEEEVPLSPETDNDEQGGDFSLIPEGFLVESSNETVIDETHPFGDELDAAISQEELDILETEPEAEYEPEEIQEEAAGGPEESIPAATDTAANTADESSAAIPTQLKQELKTVLSYMDRLLESLPDDKIEEFARSEYYDTYKKLFKELGLV